MVKKILTIGCVIALFVVPRFAYANEETELGLIRGVVCNPHCFSNPRGELADRLIQFIEQNPNAVVESGSNLQSALASCSYGRNLLAELSPILENRESFSFMPSNQVAVVRAVIYLTQPKSSEDVASLARSVVALLETESDNSGAKTLATIAFARISGQVQEVCSDLAIPEEFLSNYLGEGVDIDRFGLAGVCRVVEQAIANQLKQPDLLRQLSSLEAAAVLFLLNYDSACDIDIIDLEPIDWIISSGPLKGKARDLFLLHQRLSVYSVLSSAYVEQLKLIKCTALSVPGSSGDADLTEELVMMRKKRKSLRGEISVLAKSVFTDYAQTPGFLVGRLSMVEWD